MDDYKVFYKIAELCGEAMKNIEEAKKIADEETKKCLDNEFEEYRKKPNCNGTMKKCDKCGLFYCNGCFDECPDCLRGEILPNDLELTRRANYRNRRKRTQRKLRKSGKVAGR